MLLGADAERYVIPVLDHARVLRIRGKGMLITGIEVQPRGRALKNIKVDRYRQTWWCLPAVPRGGPLLSFSASAAVAFGQIPGQSDMKP